MTMPTRSDKELRVVVIRAYDDDGDELPGYDFRAIVYVDKQRHQERLLKFDGGGSMLTTIDKRYYAQRDTYKRYADHVLSHYEDRLRAKVKPAKVY